jgi:hypothetical protein
VIIVPERQAAVVAAYLKRKKERAVFMGEVR